MAAKACPVALKEWATVLEAMAKGEQLVLIRKGGLIEPGSGFEVVSPSFVFYPTFEHQAVNYLREPYKGYFDLASKTRAPEGKVTFAIYGESAYSTQIKDASVIERLAPFHIYNPDFLTQRLKWQPEQPIAIVIVRAYHLQPPATISVAPQYAGCKSWVELEQPVSLSGLEPVLDDTVFAEKQRQISGLIQS